MTSVGASVDLRSDTVTRPTAAMLAAMSQAELGDDVYGEDPTVSTLEREVALLLGKDSGLYVPSGTMANQLAIAVQTRPGDSIIAEAGAHAVRFEAGAAAALSGVQFELVPRQERLADDAIGAAFKPDGLQDPASTLLIVENTHNLGGGRVLHVDETRRIVAKAKSLGLATHCDGARLWNAAAALGVAERDLVEGFTTVAVCFSKGLGAPVGSALCGPAPLIARARKLRKRWGGGMRQAGVIAAGALHALHHHRGRIVDDHRRAEKLAAALRDVAERGAPLEVSYPSPGTNMVYFRHLRLAPGVCIVRLAEQGVRVGAMEGGWLRAVLHLDVDDSGLARAVEAMVALAREGS